MNKTNDKGGCWPTWEQELLLRAVLLQGKDAIQAWEKWKSSTDIDQLDVGSHRLIPLLYRNLHNQGIEDPFMGKFKGVYRRTWYENQLLFHNISTLLRSFHDAGIETMLLKGAALVLLHYKDYGVRPMADLDVLVHPEQALTAVNLMGKLGWKKAGTFIETHVIVAHGRMFRDSDGRDIDLHWYVLPECCYPHADDDFWDGAVSVRLHEVPTRALNPTDHLLHICVHGAQWNSVPTIRWVADAMMILNTSQHEIDWNRLLVQVQRRSLILPLRETLTYLRDVFSAPIPAAILSGIQNIPVSKMERVEYKYKTQSYQQKPLGALPVHWFYYLRSANNTNSRYKLLGFIKYLQYLWGAESLWQLPLYAISMTIRRIRTITNLYKSRSAR